MKYIVNRAELFDSSNKKTVIKNMNEPTNDIEVFREEICEKYGCERALLMYTQVK